MSPNSSREVSQEDFLFHLYRGSELLQDNRILEAKEELEQALTVQPRDPKGQDLLGAVYFRLGLYPRAIQIWESLEGQFPGDVAIKMNLALCYLKTGQPEPARRVLRDTVQINPEHKRAWGYLGLALQKLGELEQAQIAFEKGGRPAMARRITQYRRSLLPPPSEPAPPREDLEPELARDVREMADVAFSELDAGGLRFELAEPASPESGEEVALDASWHTLEPGEAAPAPASRLPPNPYARVARESGLPQARSVFTKTLPPPWIGEAEPEVAPAAPPLRPIEFSAPPPVRVPRIGGAMPVAAVLPPAASLLAWQGERAVERHPSGVVLVRPTVSGGFACRMEAVRVVSGGVTTLGLRRRGREAESTEALGGPADPLVGLRAEPGGDPQLVVGPRQGRRLAVLSVEDGLAFVREDLLAGFELSLGYENGRVAHEKGADDGLPVVQLRGSGAFVVEVASELGALASQPGKTLLVCREWIVGWLGRLVARVPVPAETPGAQRGLVAFWGDGTVLVAVH